MTDPDRPRDLYTAAEAALRFDIPAGSIRAWRCKQLLYPYGLDERGHPMYDRDDLIALRDHTQRRTQNRPKTRRPA